MKASKLKKLSWVIAISLIVAVGMVIGVFLLTKSGNLNQPQTITGKITAISNQCNVDGVCSVTLDNAKTIVTGCGLGPGGKTCRAYNQSNLRQGERIEATVMQTGAGSYNLECDVCTIHVAP